MREIRFRAWDADRKEMIFRFKNNKSQTPSLLQSDNEGEYNFFCGSYQRNGDWQEPQLMQYTGLKDKNGVDIYEGDILRHAVDKGLLNWEVRFKDGCFGIVNLPDNGYFFPCSSVYYFSDREVTGNIYEPVNP